MNHCWYWWLSIHNNRINIIFYLEKIVQRQLEWSTILSTFIWYIMNTGKYISYDSLNKQQRQQSFKKCHVGAQIPCVCAFIAGVEPFHMFFFLFYSEFKSFSSDFSMNTLSRIYTSNRLTIHAVSLCTRIYSTLADFERCKLWKQITYHTIYLTF